ncbi:hypothetical protein SAMN05216421_0861 [Halopseudomonas xinjiangensis]|uniref:Uncharacterized protein n=1 Tax=Halopseudomonas xinjiangensis TaxID=487184 RepID=A0A1H1P8F1_9GAMM|nr:hypothetical protein SAMN05216421_0861 [Halopseudomonas xinjiangensis]
MHSDWDDAPQRIRKRKDTRRFAAVLLAVAVSVAVALLVGQAYLTSGRPILTSWQTERAPQVPPLPTSRTDAPSVAITKPSHPPPQKTPEELFREQVERDRQRAATRQTEFNDSNYVPKRSINVIPAVAEVQRVATRSNSRPMGLTGTGHATVNWQDARGRRSSWQTTFTYRNSTIDNTTFCLNVGKGSIPYRSCRKGAREWLKAKCRTKQPLNDGWRDMYCHAYQAYRT